MSLHPDHQSKCWSCRYWDWCIELACAGPANWINICNNPAEYEPGDDVVECAGYVPETEVLEPL